MILFTDLDGTLLTDEKKLTEGNRCAIEEALNQNHQIVICTGRPLCSAKIQAKALGLTGKGCYIICFNGGEIYDTSQDTSIFKKTLPLTLVRHIFDEAHRRGIHIQTYDKDHILSEEDRPELSHYSKTYQVPALVVPDVTAALSSEPCKMIAIDEKNQQVLEDFRQAMSPWAHGKIDMFFSNPAFLEHVPVGVSKGQAVRLLCDFLNIPLSETIAVGDAENDIPMLQSTAVGAVMCNGDKYTRSFGSYITEHDNNHDGVAEVIHNFILKRSGCSIGA